MNVGQFIRNYKAMVNTQRLRDLAASYRARGAVDHVQAFADYNTEMANYLDNIASILQSRTPDKAAFEVIETGSPTEARRISA
jgi:hypothetical protein